MSSLLDKLNAATVGTKNDEERVDEIDRPIEDSAWHEAYGKMREEHIAMRKRIQACRIDCETHINKNSLYSDEYRIVLKVLDFIEKGTT